MKGERIKEARGFQTGGTDGGDSLRNAGDRFKLAEYQGSGIPAPPEDLTFHPQVINEFPVLRLFPLL